MTLMLENEIFNRIGLGFNRSMQQIGQIVLPVFGSLAFFLGDYLIAVPLNLARFVGRWYVFADCIIAIADQNQLMTTLIDYRN
jgi:hypothetical protein